MILTFYFSLYWRRIKKTWQRPPCQWMAATASILAKMSSVWSSALLDVPSTNCRRRRGCHLNCPSAEDCEDHDHVPRQAVDVVQPATATTMHSRPSSGGCHHTGWMNPTKNWLQHWLWSLVPSFLHPHQGPSIPGRCWCWPPPYKGSLVGPPLLWLYRYSIFVGPPLLWLWLYRYSISVITIFPLLKAL